MRFVDCTGSLSYLEISNDNRIQINIFRTGDFFKKSSFIFLYLYENRVLFSWLHLKYGPLIIKIYF